MDLLGLTLAEVRSKLGLTFSYAVYTADAVGEVADNALYCIRQTWRPGQDRWDLVFTPFLSHSE